MPRDCYRELLVVSADILCYTSYLDSDVCYSLLRGKLMKIDFGREKQWWDAKAPKEEQDLADEVINRDLRWREIERHLKEVETILDVGAGTGAFSILLA